MIIRLFAFLLLITSCSFSLSHAQERDLKVPFSVQWKPMFEKGILIIKITNDSDSSVKIIPHLSFYFFYPNESPKIGRGSEEDDVYCPTVLLLATGLKKDLNHSTTDRGGLEPSVITVSPGETKEIDISSPEITALATKASEADFLFVRGSASSQPLKMENDSGQWISGI